jgi:hypothetical protein
MENGNYLETFLTQIYQPNSRSGKSDINKLRLYIIYSARSTNVQHRIKIIAV